MAGSTENNPVSRVPGKLKKSAYLLRNLEINRSNQVWCTDITYIPLGDGHEMTGKQLDIGVLIPTRNSMPHIMSHIDAIKEWLPHVREVVIVDSQSDDGTMEYLKQNISHEAVQLFDHPPGLYESWNFGISKVRSKYTYVSTISDHMPFQSLELLHSKAEETSADITLSAPELVLPSGERVKQDWPLHRFLREADYPKGQAVEVPAIQCLLWNIADLPGTLLGSSASNLYRTEILQSSPFPTDFGHAGDSAWAVRHSLSRRWTIVPGAKSKFLLHSKQTRGTGDRRQLRLKMYQLAQSVLKETEQLNNLSACAKEVLPALSHLLDLYVERNELTIEFNQLKRRGMPWYVSAQGWALRNRKKQIGSEMDGVRDEIIRKNGS